MTVYWSCRTCGASGTGDKAAEQHVRETTHTTETYARPRKSVEGVLADRYWLTGAGWSAAGGRMT